MLWWLINFHQFNSVQPLSHVWFCDPMDYSMPGFPVHHQLPNLAKTLSIESVMPSNHFTFCCPLLLLPSIFPNIRVFSNESVLHIRWPKYCSFSFSISPSSEYSGPISFRIDWLDFLTVQRSLKSLLQHYSSKASILWHSAFFIIQLLHPYMTTGKTITLTRWTFFCKVMSLLFNMLSMLVIAFLPWISEINENWFSCSYDNLKEWKLLNEFLLSLSFISFDNGRYAQIL